MKKKIVLKFLFVIFGVFIFLANSPTPLPNKDNFLQFLLRKISYTYIKFKPDKFCNLKLPSSPIVIDVVIPVIEKDANTLILTLDSLRANLMQPIGKIYLIAPESEVIRKIAKEKNCEFVLEENVLPKFSNNTKRKGWIKQQYLKLNADTIVKNEYFLVIDADTTLIRPQIFVKPGKEVLNVLSDYWFSRKLMVKKALGFNKFYNLDFTSHHMLFSKTKLQHLKKHLENIHHKKWNDALDVLEIPDGSFSEYELYANFVLTKYRKKIEIVCGKNVILPRDCLNNVKTAIPFLSKHYKTLTMHSHLSIACMLKK